MSQNFQRAAPATPLLWFNLNLYNTMAKTPATKKKELVRKWRLIDADGKILGRMSTEIATYLRGKYQNTYAPYKDEGDIVVVINTDKVKVTGNKEEKKLYRWHTWHPGGLKEKKLSEIRAKDSRELISEAVLGMVPRNRLRSRIMSRLKLYKGSSHPHDKAPFEAK